MDFAEKRGYFNKAINTFTGRVARNVYFWLGYFLNFYQNHAQFKYGSEAKFFFLLSLILFLCAAVYLNNLWLLPKFFKRKFYKAYLLRFSALLFLSAWVLLLINYLFDKYFPLESFGDQVMISLGPPSVFKAIAADPGVIPELLLGAIVCMLLLFFLFFMAWFMNDYFVQQKRLDQALKEKLETDLALIKYQISPHFLFNTLNNLYGMSLIKSDHLSKSLLDLASILRYILYESGTGKIHFNREKEIMNAYIQLELLRLHKTETFSFQIEADTNYELPPLLWLPVLENAFKHGTRHISQEHFLDFRLTIKNNVWILQSENTFKPTGEQDLTMQEGSGMGLHNLRKRLDIIYPKKHDIRETVKGNLYSVYIKIDLNE